MFPVFALLISSDATSEIQITATPRTASYLWLTSFVCPMPRRIPSIIPTVVTPILNSHDQVHTPISVVVRISPRSTTSPGWLYCKGSSDWAARLLAKHPRFPINHNVDQMIRLIRLILRLEFVAMCKVRVMISFFFLNLWNLWKNYFIVDVSHCDCRSNTR